MSAYHDPLCPWYRVRPSQRVLPPRSEVCEWCRVIREADARARADERQRIFDGIGKDREITARVMDAARADEREWFRREVEKMQDHAGVDFDGPWTALQAVLILIEGGSSD